MVFKTEYEHHDVGIDFKLIREELLKFKDKKVLVAQHIKLEETITKIGNCAVINCKEGKKYVHVIGFVKDKKYKYRSYKGFRDKTIFISEIEGSCIQYKEEIKKIVKDAGFTGKVSFEPPDYFLPLWDPLDEIL
jgi:hypothetical protein